MAKKEQDLARKSPALRQLEEKTNSQLWWLAPKKDESAPLSVDRKGTKLARAINRAATDREIANIPTRWRNYVFFREVTGRPSMSQLAYGMAQRPATFVNYYSSFQFSGTKARFVGQMVDVYINRLLGHMTHISFIPSNGTWEERNQCQEREEFVEAAFDQLKFWQARTTMGTEGLWYGTGCLYFKDDGFGCPAIEAIHPDCVLVSNPDDDNPYDVILRFWANKTILLEQHKDNPDAVEAIANARTAYPAFYFGRSALDCSDIVPYLVGYTRPLSDSVPGRHVEVIGDYALRDEPWTYPIPVEFWQHRQLPGSLFGQGIPEVTLQIGQWIDGILNVIQESEQRGGAGKWLYDENSNVNPDALGDTVAAAVSYLGKEPKYITPEGIGQWSLQHLDMLMNLGRAINHVSESSVKGEAPKAFTSGVALEKYAQIDDQTFLEEIGRLEDLDKRCAYQVLMLAKRLNCNFIHKGAKKTLEELKLNKVFRIDSIQAFNVGRLSQTVAGRIEILKEMYAEKTIDKRLYIKYQQTPDIPGMFSELNGDADAIQKQLDALVKSDDYIPPFPFMDYDFAIATVESRMEREMAQGAPQEVLDRLSMWRATVKSLQAQNNTPDAVPGQPPSNVEPPGPLAGQPIPGIQGGPGFGLQPPPEAANIAPIQPANATPALNPTGA